MQVFGNYINSAFCRVHSDKAHGSHAVTLADDASIVIADSLNMCQLVGVFEITNGFSAWFGTGFNHSVLLSSYGGTTNWGVSDQDGRTCLFASSHDLTFKNRSGSSEGYMLYIFGGKLAL